MFLPVSSFQAVRQQAITQNGDLWLLRFIITIQSWKYHIDSLVQDCSNSNASAMESLQSCTKPWIWSIEYACSFVICFVAILLSVVGQFIGLCILQGGLQWSFWVWAQPMRNIETLSVIGSAQTQNYPWLHSPWGSCPSTSDVFLKDTDKSCQFQTIRKNPKHKPCTYGIVYTVAK